MNPVQQLLEDYNAFRELFEDAPTARSERFPKLLWPDLEAVTVAIARRTLVSAKDLESELESWVDNGEGWLRRRSALVVVQGGGEQVIRGDAEDPGPVLYGELAKGSRSLHIRHLRADRWRIETIEECAESGEAVLARTVHHLGWNGGLRYHVYFQLVDGESLPFGFRFLGFGG